MKLRNYCKQLEVRLQYIEYEKLKIVKELNYIGNQEPTHPIFINNAMPPVPYSRKKSVSQLMTKRIERFKTPTKQSSSRKKLNVTSEIKIRSNLTNLPPTERHNAN